MTNADLKVAISRVANIHKITQLNSTQRASMDAGVKTPQCPHLSSHYFISIPVL